MVNSLILYKDFEDGDVLKDMTWLLQNCDSEYYNKEDVTGLFYGAIGRLVEIAGANGFEGNLWHSYLTYLLANHENAYSMAAEITGEIEGSINNIALHDFKIFKALFDIDLSVIDKALGTEGIPLIFDYKKTSKRGNSYSKLIRKRLIKMAVDLKEAKDAEEFKDIVTEFYRDFGVGSLGLHKAFRVEHNDDGVQIAPINNIAAVTLDDLVGYDIAKAKLIANTEAFLEGKPANNCLLFGDAGTGKSTSIKAILNQYYDRGLRMIEIYKHQFKDLNDVIATIKDRNYRFVIYMDDLSFEEFEIEYKYLKAIIEGGLEKKPSNVLIYATSNRRHLIREEYGDKEETRQDMHTSDTVQEKLSLVARFGETIYFGGPTKKEYDHIVKELAERCGIEMEEEKLLLEANKWELSHGGRSGRTAQQFVDHLLGTM